MARPDDVISAPRPSGATYTDFFPTLLSISTLYPDTSFPLVISPLPEAMMTLENGNSLPMKSKQALLHLIKTNRKWISSSLLQHGALLFRGFSGIDSPKSFQDAASALLYPLPPFTKTYTGTSARLKGIGGAQAVHTASEIPSWQSIPAHLEMSFKKSFPPLIVFWAQVGF